MTKLSDIFVAISSRNTDLLPNLKELFDFAVPYDILPKN